MELFSGNSLRVKAVGCFHRGAPSLMFYRILNVTLSEEISTSRVAQENLELLVHSNFSDFQAQTQEYEIVG